MYSTAAEARQDLILKGLIKSEANGSRSSRACHSWNWVAPVLQDGPCKIQRPRARLGQSMAKLRLCFKLWQVGLPTHESDKELAHLNRKLSS